jgi:hypothetical protein
VQLLLKQGFEPTRDVADFIDLSPHAGFRVEQFAVARASQPSLHTGMAEQLILLGPREEAQARRLEC